MERAVLGLLLALAVGKFPDGCLTFMDLLEKGV